MKRIFKIIFISLFSLLFLLVFMIYREQDLSNMYNLFGFTGEYENGDIYFNQPLSDQEKEQVIQKIQTITDENEVAVVFGYYEGTDEKTDHFHYYVSGNNTFIEDMVPLSTPLANDFSKGNRYLTTESDDVSEETIELFSFYQDAEYTLYPIQYIIEQPEAMKFGFTYYFNAAQDQKFYADLFDTAFEEFDIQNQSVHQHEYDSQQALKKNMMYISIIMLTISMLFILFQISDSLKEIAILKLNGYRLKDMLSYLFKDFILLNAAFSILIPMVLTFLFFRTINQRVLQFLGQLLLMSVLLASLYVVMVLVGILLVKYIQLSHLLKNKNINQSLSHFAYITLIATSILLLPIMSDSIQRVATAIPYYVEHASQLKQIEDVHYIQTFEDPNRAWEFNQMDYIMGNENERNNKQIEVYNHLDELNVLYRMSPVFLGGNEEESETVYLAYQMNQKAFNLQNFFVDGEKIEVENNQSINVFMDSDTYQKEAWRVDNFTSLVNVEVDVYLFDAYDMISFDLEEYQNFDNVKAPIFIYTTHPLSFEPTITSDGVYFDGQFLSQIEVYFKEVGLDEVVTLGTMKEEHQKLTDDFLYTLRTEGMLLLPGLLCLTVLFISFRKFVFLANERKWTILKSVGYRTVDLTSEYLLELVLLNVLILLVQFAFFQDIQWFSIGLLVAFSGMSYLLMNWTSHQLEIKRL